jgi:hypothetical protein
MPRRVEGSRHRGAGRRPRAAALAALCALAGCARCCAENRDTRADACPAEAPALSPGAAGHALKTVFLVLLENQDWEAIRGSPSAPYINGQLLPRFAHAEAYRNGGLHPSLPNYLALEAGDPLGVDCDLTAAELSLPVPCHLATWLEAVGLPWRSYQEGIDGSTCPILDRGLYVSRHDPFVYFADVAPRGEASRRCIEHVRPYAELARDLARGAVARYSFITPDLCHSGHDSCPPQGDPIRQSDAWLERELPAIMASPAWLDGGVILVTWDEGRAGDRPIGLIAISPLAKPGYAGAVPYSHASTLRTVQEILGVTPLLRGAARAESLSDLFTTYP